MIGEGRTGGEIRRSSSGLQNILMAIFATFIITAVGGLAFFDDFYGKQVAPLQAENQRLKARYALKEGNVIGGDANDLYCEPCYSEFLCARPRGYVEIDGKPVADYFSKTE